MSKLTNEELIRYNRHLVLDEFGIEAQMRLKSARVLVVGAGGLGCPALLYLTAAGIGTIGIVDFDKVSLSNLQRQVLYSIDDLDQSKSDAAVKRLARINPNVNLFSINERLTAGNALNVLVDYDVILDGTDNFPTRYLLNDACVLLDKPLVYGSVLAFEGQVAVFNLNRNATFSSNYRDLFPEPPAIDIVPNCEQAGVLGAIPGMIGTMQAIEAIKIVTGIGEPLADQLVIVDALGMQFSSIKLMNNLARQEVKMLIDYDDFCGINEEKNKPLSTDKNKIMKEISVQELQELQESGADFQLIDVREPHEYDICNLGGELIPMSQIPHNVDKISRDRKVVVHCRSGKRSGDIVLWLERNQNFDNLYNLKGGILAWAKEIDSDMPTY